MTDPDLAFHGQRTMSSREICRRPSPDGEGAARKDLRVVARSIDGVAIHDHAMEVLSGASA